MNRCESLQSSITSLLEKHFHNLYVNSSVPINDSNINKFYQENTELYVFNTRPNLLSHYKKNLTKGMNYSSENNYIYQITKPINLFSILSNRDLEIAHQKNIVTEDCTSIRQLNNYPEKHIRLDVLASLDFDGYQIGTNDFKKITVFFSESRLDSFIASLQLVDGNTKRFSTGRSGIELDVPDNVVQELFNYTVQQQRTFSAPVKKWLQKHIQKPYSEITLYRGDGLSFDMIRNFDYLDFETQISKVQKWFKSYLSLDSLEDVKKNAQVVLNHKNLVSWSTSPQVAQNFCRSGKEFRFLLRTTVPASSVVVDFNLLPKSLIQEKFTYWQNEVLVGDKLIPAEIIYLQLSKSGKYWLDSVRDYIRQ